MTISTKRSDVNWLPAERAPKPLGLTEPLPLASIVKYRIGDEHMWLRLLETIDKDCEYSRHHYIARLLSVPVDPETLKDQHLFHGEDGHYYALLCLAGIEDVAMPGHHTHD